MTARRSPDRLAQTALVVALTAALVLLAAAPLATYSWVELGTSEAAAQGVEGDWVTRAGFVLLGLAVLGTCVLRHRSWGWLATGLHAAFGVAMILVAVYSHAPWEPGVPYVELEDRLHSVFASVVGFAFIAGVATALFVRHPRTRATVAGDLVALLVTGAAPLLMDSEVWGVAQRAMFLTAALWYAVELVRARR